MLRASLIFTLSLLAGCASTPPGQPIKELAPEINQTLIDGPTLLMPGDVISVRFVRLPKWDQEEIVVREDGLGSLLSLGEIEIAGKSISMLEELLTTEYGLLLADSELTISRTQAAESRIYIMGEVMAPGSYPMPAGKLSLIEALGLAEGFIRDTALLEQVQLVRWDPEQNHLLTWKIDASRDEWVSGETIVVQAHDVIYVPAQPIVHVNDWIDRYIRRNIPFPYWFVLQ